MSIWDVVQRFRAELLGDDRQAASDLVQAYGEAWTEIRERLEVLLGKISEEREAGRTVSASWLLQRDRLQSLQRQAEEQVRRFVDRAEVRIREEQKTAVTAALRHSPELVREALPEEIAVRTGFHHLPTRAVEDLAGFLADGSPLRSALNEMPGNAGQVVRRSLLTGVATGQHPRRIAAQVRQELGGQLGSTLTLSRTSVLSAYRETTRRSYEENADVVEGWIWTAALGPRCCPACVAMHGTFHPVTERLNGHHNCRCVMVPRTSSGLALETGSAWFDRQPESVKREILGPKALAALQAGEVSLEDFVGLRHDHIWGEMRYARSLKQALA